MKLSTFRIGQPPTAKSELRLAVTRRPPRGLPRAEWNQLFDVWLPVLAPSKELLRQAHTIDWRDAGARARFFNRYERELLGSAEKRQTVRLLAELGKRLPISIGCFCEDESRCHRSRLREMIRREAAG